MAKVGRPTEYTPALLKKAIEYCDYFVAAHKAETEAFPSLAELAITLDISRETIHSWRKDPDKKEFSDIVEKVLTLQELSLHNNGLLNKFNSSIVKLMLTKHGYTDKQDVTSGDAPLQPLLVKFLNADSNGNTGGV